MFWLKQFHLCTSGQPYVTFTIEAMRAIMQALPDDADAADREVAFVPNIAGRNLDSREDQAQRHLKRANLNGTNGINKSSAGIPNGRQELGGVAWARRHGDIRA